MTPDIQTARKLAQDHCDAWTNKAPDQVASRYSENTTMIMNGGEPMNSRSQIGEMAAGFMTEFPDLERWSCFFDQCSALLRWIRVSFRLPVC